MFCGGNGSNGGQSGGGGEGDQGSDDYDGWIDGGIGLTYGAAVSEHKAARTQKKDVKKVNEAGGLDVYRETHKTRERERWRQRRRRAFGGGHLIGATMPSNARHDTTCKATRHIRHETRYTRHITVHTVRTLYMPEAGMLIRFLQKRRGERCLTQSS